MSFEHIPFENQYKMFRILNYGKAYGNYKTYKIADNPEKITIIYIDNAACKYANKTDIISHNVEIHFSQLLHNQHTSIIMLATDITNMLSKYQFVSLY